MKQQKTLMWRPAVQLSQLGLHPTHDFRCYVDGPCSNGLHWEMACVHCGVHPIRPTSLCPCKYEMWGPNPLPQVLRDRGARVALAALHPCPGAEKVA